MKYSRYILVVPLFISSMVYGITSLDLPDIGDSSGSVISPKSERYLGRIFMRSIRKHATIIDDPEIENYIESIGYKLVANSDNNNLTFTFFIVDSPDINAFAAPGGIIGVNSGTILNSRNENELAGVLAHEIAHVTQRHIARTLEKSGQSSVPAALALLGSILIGIVDQQAGAAALAFVTGARLQNQINFTRENEREADSIGIQLLARSDYDPHGIPSFFERLQQKSGYHQNTAPEFLRTHPLTSSRIAESKARAEQYLPSRHTNTINYELVRAKLEFNNYKNVDNAITSFEKRLSDSPAKRNNAVRYGYIMALTKAGEYDTAWQQSQVLLEWDHDNIAYILVATNIALQQGNYDAALDMYQKAYRLYPDYKPLVLAYAKARLDNKQPTEARDLLRRYRRQQELGPAYYDLLAQAESESGSVVNSAIAKADFFYLIGDTKLAIQRLNQVEDEVDLDYYQKEKIAARISQLEYELELEEHLKI